MKYLVLPYLVKKVLGWDKLRNQGMKFQNIFHSASLFGIHKDEIV